MVNFTTLLETGLVGLPNAEKSHTRSQSHFTKYCKHRWVSPPPTPPSPPAVSARNWTKYNKPLKDPVRGAGSAQMQIRSYRNRQSGNLARKVRNAFPWCTALKHSLEVSPLHVQRAFQILLLYFSKDCNLQYMIYI